MMAMLEDKQDLQLLGPIFFFSLDCENVLVNLNTRFNLICDLKFIGNFKLKKPVWMLSMNL